MIISIGLPSRYVYLMLLSLGHLTPLGFVLVENATSFSTRSFLKLLVMWFGFVVRYYTLRQYLLQFCVRQWYCIDCKEID